MDAVVEYTAQHRSYNQMGLIDDSRNCTQDDVKIKILKLIMDKELEIVEET